MKIGHVAIYVNDLEKIRDFYVRYFKATSNNKYHNLQTGFESYFLSFEKGTKLEIMRIPNLKAKTEQSVIGLAHIAIQVGSKRKVDELTDDLKKDGHTVLSSPRMTGDGYYESVVLDPEGNRIEIIKRDNNVFP